jgi:hypothetical protein
MVFMRMGKNNGIQPFYFQAQHLTPEIRGRINSQGGIIGLHQNTGTETLIFLIRRCANLAAAGYHWHSTAGTCSKKSNF